MNSGAFVVLVWLLWSAPAVVAQMAPATQTSAQDSVVRAGWRDGSRAADRLDVRRYGEAAFFGRLMLGAFGLIASSHSGFKDPNDLAALAGTGVVIGVPVLALRRGAALPASEVDRIREAGPANEQAYRDAYRRRLRLRRVRSALLGATAGTAIGFGALIVVAILGSET